MLHNTASKKIFAPRRQGAKKNVFVGSPHLACFASLRESSVFDSVIQKTTQTSNIFCLVSNAGLYDSG
jgi:hypothetical protein